jgi:hypothetical protein
METDDEYIYGVYLCEEVKFAIMPPCRKGVLCHCEDCRMRAGAPYRIVHISPSSFLSLIAYIDMLLTRKMAKFERSH